MLKQLVGQLSEFKMDINNTVLEELNSKSYFQIWNEQWGRLTTEPGGDIAMLRLLKVAEQEYSPEDQSLDQMALMVKVEARTDLDEIEAERRKAWMNGEKMVYAEADRPMVVYRRWMKALRFLKDFNYPVGSIIRDLELEQSLPVGELDNPDDVDPYTGEFNPTAALERAYFQAPERDKPIRPKTSIEVFANRLTELAKAFVNHEAIEWAKATFTAILDDDNNDELDNLQLCLYATFQNEIEYYERLLVAEAETLKYSEGFDAADGLDDVDFEFDDIDPRTPDFMEFQEDMKMHDFFYLREEAQYEVNALKEWMQMASEAIDLAFISARRQLRSMLANKVPEGELDIVVEDLLGAGTLDQSMKLMQDKDFRNKMFGIKKSIFGNWRDQIRNSDAAKSYIARLQDYLDRGEHIPDVVLLFSSFQNGLCFEEEDADQLKLPSGMSLGEYIEIFGDEILENFNDPSGVRDTTPSWEFMQKYVEDTINEYASTGVPFKQQDRRKFNAFNEPNYIKGVLKAAVTLKDVSPQKLSNAGYEFMRQKVSPKGNLAYHQALKEGKSRKEAMAMFYKIANAETRISSIRPTGLVLDTGRVVNWDIAVTKVTHDEIVFDHGDRDRLKKILSQKGWGKKLQSVL